MNRRVEFRADGVFAIREGFEKPIIQQVTHGWHLLFLDATGKKRFGFVVKIDLEHQLFLALDSVAYPDAPSPLGALSEAVPFEAVIFAQNGFNWHTADIYQGRKKIGRRKIACIVLEGTESNVTVGWVDRRAGLAYVDLVEGKWQLRTDISSSGM